ncbi:CIC11C00000001390 [Sungouiella intermedia]|uniref:CIC11C00000001390 n=1 Tax=Sungouiella intermedia TaxID=45354 RepID=A0A1L0DBG4_9ASCO|nr:CIC11C00000001390 [[Candida] intermedia]
MRVLVLALLIEAGFCFITLPLKYVVREQSMEVYEPQTSNFLTKLSHERELALEADVGPQKTKIEFLVDFWGYSNTLTSKSVLKEDCSSDRSGESLYLGDVQAEDVPFTTRSLQNHLRFGLSEVQEHELLKVDKMNIVQLLNIRRRSRAH